MWGEILLHLNFFPTAKFFYLLVSSALSNDSRSALFIMEAIFPWMFQLSTVYISDIMTIMY